MLSNDGTPYKVPIRKLARLTPLENAEEIISDLDDWLRDTGGTAVTNTANKLVREAKLETLPEPEIKRDFRDME